MIRDTLVEELPRRRFSQCRRTNRTMKLMSTCLVHVAVLVLLLVLAAEEKDWGVTAVEMVEMNGGCLQVTLKAGDHIQADPRCIVSRGVGLALRPPASLEQGGVLDGLKRRLRKAQSRQEKRRDHPLERLSNTMASNETECFLAPPFPGDIALVSVSSGGRESRRENTISGHRRKPTDNHRDRPSSRTAQARTRQGEGRDRQAATGNDHSEKPRKLVLLTQAIVAVGPEVIVQRFPAVDAGERGSFRRQQQRGSAAIATMGALSVCEGQGPVAVAGCGKLKKLRLRPGQKRVVDSSRAVGWTSGVMYLAGEGGDASASSSSNKGVAGPSAVTTFVGPGTVYVQTHSLSGLRRLLLPKPGVGVSMQGGVSSSFLGVGGRDASSIPRRAKIVGLSLKRGLAKRAKAGTKRVSIALAFFALYLVVYSLATALLLEGRDGIVNAPKHAVQVVRSLVKVARRVAVVLVRLGRDELWREGEGVAGGVSPPREHPVER